VKRIWRRLFDGFAAISLSLAIIAFVAWGLGGPAGHTWHLAYDTGSAGVPSTQHNWEINLSGRLAFAWKSNHWTRWTFHRVGIPYLAIVGLLAIAPAIWRRHPPARRAGPAGHCSGCGYDLRATPGRCPECGLAALASGGSACAK
jgi:hypothetical protein